MEEQIKKQKLSTENGGGGERDGGMEAFKGKEWARFCHVAASRKVNRGGVGPILIWTGYWAWPIRIIQRMAHLNGLTTSRKLWLNRPIISMGPI